MTVDFKPQHRTPDRMLLEYVTDTFMLGLLVWREARSETYAGKLAVAWSVLNRVERPSWWGRTLLEVITKKWQYSSLTDPNDRQLTRWPNPTDSTWWECLQVAHDVLNNLVGNPVKHADSYYAVSMDRAGNPPKWATPETFVAQVGDHKFYNLDRDVEV